MPHRICVRAARVEDVDAMHALMMPFAAGDIILARDKDDIYQHLQEFLIAEYDGRLAGVAAVHVYGKSLAEVRSLVVDPQFQQHGVGRLLVQSCEKWVAELGVGQIFALTYVTGFFEKQGYHIVSKESLPHKVWMVCVHCSRFADCDEVAVRKALPAVVQQQDIVPLLEVEQP